VLKTVYARSKYEGEVLALRECQKTFTIRPGWLFGGNIKHKKNFFYQRYLEAKKSKFIKSANDKFGCPTLVGDLIIKIDEIVNAANPGIYHVTNVGGCSRVDYVRKIIKTCGLDTEVMAVDSSNFPRKADVPDCELLENSNVKKAGLGLLPSWEDAIERYANIIKNIL
jgi:dTDP-4-dehydrorhamnose reductase